MPSTRRRRPRPPKPTRQPEPPPTHPNPPEPFSVPKAELIEKLFNFGFLAYKDLEAARSGATDQELRTALIAYQLFHGLDPDGWAGPVTERSMQEPRFCGLPDVMPLQITLCRWPLPEADRTLPWHVRGAPRQLDAAQVRDAFAWAWAQVEAACNVKPVWTDNASQAKVLSEFAPIDRAGRTLAWSELPCSSRPTVCKQRYDTDEGWEVSETPRRYMIDLARVALHEILHALGIPHLDAGNLMQPTYSERIRTLQAGDIRELVMRYNEPRPGQPPPAPSGGKFLITLEVEGTFVGGTLPPPWKILQVKTA